MAIVGRGGMKVRVKGIDQTIRTLAGLRDETHTAAKRGIRKAAQHLLEKIKSKFGSYQATGGTGGGAWAKLKYETMRKKLSKYGFSGKPLIGYGDMQDSFYIKEAGTRKALAASVASNDPKLIHHVFGAPRAGVPKRDPFLVTADEERDACHDIIENEIREVI